MIFFFLPRREFEVFLVNKNVGQENSVLCCADGEIETKADVVLKLNVCFQPKKNSISFYIKSRLKKHFSSSSELLPPKNIWEVRELLNFDGKKGVEVNQEYPAWKFKRRLVYI